MSIDLTRKQVSALWNIISASGLAPSPHVAVEQISCLILIKHLEQIGHKSSWSSLLESPDPGQQLAKDGFRELREAEIDVSTSVRRLVLNGLFSDAYFQLEATKTEALIALLEAIDELFTIGEVPFAGDAFDLLLSIAALGGNSLNATPIQLSRFIVSLLDPVQGERLIDPAVGTGRLLLNAEQYMSDVDESVPKLPVGIESDKSIARIAWVNLLLHEVDPAQLYNGNSVAGATESSKKLNRLLRRGHYDVVLSDLPFGNIGDDLQPGVIGYLPPAAFGEQDRFTRRLELLLIWRTLDLLKVGGRAALIVPQGVLYGTTRAQRRLRRELMTKHVVDGIILLPQGIVPQQKTPAALLLFKKAVPSSMTQDLNMGTQPRTRSVWFYEVAGGELSSTEKHPNNSDFYDALVHYRHQTMLQEPPLESRFYYQPVRQTEHVGQGDSFDELVTLRTSEMGAGAPTSHSMSFFRRPATVTKQWRILVREWIQNPEWQDSYGQTVGSHDEHQRVRPEYEAQFEPHLYVNGELKKGFLEPGCIEARRWSLDINDYRWFEAPHAPEEPSALDLIDELRELEQGILHRLDALRSLLGEEG